MTWADLIAAVRAQIDVSDDQAYGWLLDRARVMNAETGWLVTETSWPSTGADFYPMPEALVTVEAVLVGNVPYRRSTAAQMDNAKELGYAANRGTLNRHIYSESWDDAGVHFLALYPVPTLGPPAPLVQMRYLADVVDDRTGSPPFPTDLQGVLADGAIAVGLARMDERFDSAGYFDAKFSDGIQRLKRRRHSHVGRGGTPIRLTR